MKKIKLFFWKVQDELTLFLVLCFSQVVKLVNYNQITASGSEGKEFSRSHINAHIDVCTALPPLRNRNHSCTQT